MPLQLQRITRVLPNQPWLERLGELSENIQTGQYTRFPAETGFRLAKQMRLPFIFENEGKMHGSLSFDQVVSLGDTMNRMREDLGDSYTFKSQKLRILSRGVVVLDVQQTNAYEKQRRRMATMLSAVTGRTVSLIPKFVNVEIASVSPDFQDPKLVSRAENLLTQMVFQQEILSGELQAEVGLTQNVSHFEV